MGFFTGLDISGSALIAERLRMETISNNLANWRTIREDGQRLRPYRRRTPVFYAGAPEMTGAEDLGVRFAGVAYSEGFIARESEDPKNDPDAVKLEDLAGRPDLGSEHVGKRLYPDINLAVEMVDMMSAAHAYQANVTAMQLTRSMLQGSLQLLA